jgi:VRR-NUC domain
VFPRLKEGEWQRQVIQLAQLHGWRVAHFRSVCVARQDGSTSWQTPVEADGEGFPDLLLCKPGKIIVAELKRDEGRVTPDQREWLRTFELAGVEAYTWRPRDWTEVQAVLGGQIVPAMVAR